MAKQYPVSIKENGVKVWGYNKKGQPICNSPKRKKPGKFCQQWSGLGTNGRCEDHGGRNAPPGPLHPRYQTGRFSQFIPSSIRPLWEAMYSDPEYLSNKSSIAMSNVRLAKIYEEIEDSLEDASITRLVGIAQRFEKALAYENALDEIRVFRELAYQVIGMAQTCQNVVLLQKRQQVEERHNTELKEFERKRIESASKHVSAEDVMVAFAHLIQAIQARVADKETLHALALDIDRILVEGKLTNATLRIKRDVSPAQELITEDDFPDYEEEDKSSSPEKGDD